MSVHLCVRLSVSKCFFDFNEIWRVGRGRWVMHDGMQYNQIQGQGHEPFKVRNLAVFKNRLLCHLQWGAGNWPQILKLGHNIYISSGHFFIFSLVLCHVTLKLAETSVMKSRPSVPYGANLFALSPCVSIIASVVSLFWSLAFYYTVHPPSLTTHLP